MSEEGKRQLALRSWRLENFKSITEASIDFSPLTLLVGANSSGKSSVIQSLLLVTQSAQQQSIGADFPLNGPLAALGEYVDVRSAFAAKGRVVKLGGVFDLQSPGYPGAMAVRRGKAWMPGDAVTHWRVSLGAASINEPGSAMIVGVEVEVNPLLEDAPPPVARDSDMSISLRADVRGQGEIAAEVEQLRRGRLVWPARDEFALGYQGFFGSTLVEDELALRGVFFRAGIPHNILTTWTLGRAAARVWIEARTERLVWSGRLGVGARNRSPALRSRQDARLRLPRPVSPEQEREIAERWVGIAADEIRRWHEEAAHELVPLSVYLGRQRLHIDLEERMVLRSAGPELVELIADRLQLEEPVLLPPEAAVAGELNDSMSELHDFFRDRVVYLGPLRQDPQVVYRARPVGATGFIGSKGEYLASVLHGFRNQQVDCPLADGTLAPMSLATAVDYWVKALELAESVQTRTTRLGIQLTVRRSDQLAALDLTSVGVGVSQILPVIVTCLLTPQGSLILLEQPELHLHPAVQQKLGDFLLACAKGGRQLVVETHSEYLVTRLRLRIAEDPTNRTRSTVTLIFAEQSNGVSSFREVQTNEFGAIEDWPEGFFDQAPTESRLLLERGLEKRLGVSARSKDKEEGGAPEDEGEPA